MNFIEEAAALQDTLLKYRRYFHQYPEVSRQEFNTAGKIVEILSGLGLEVQSQVAHPLPGVVALLRGGHPGPTVALRADMDALSQTEEMCIRDRVCPPQAVRLKTRQRISKSAIILLFFMLVPPKRIRRPASKAGNDCTVILA